MPQDVGYPVKDDVGDLLIAGGEFKEYFTAQEIEIYALEWKELE